MQKGLFITFEGGEGSGKSTQIQLLNTYLTGLNQSVVLTREPGGTKDADDIRALLTQGGVDKWDKKSELLLFMAGRRNHLVKKIWPALENKQIIISDRYLDSSLAYQCYGYGYDENFEKDVHMIYRFIAGDFMPDLTILLDIDPDIGVNRSKTRAGDNKEQRFEQLDLSFHHNLRAGYLKLAEQYKNRYAIVNANQDVDAVHQEIKKIVDRYINAD